MAPASPGPGEAGRPGRQAPRHARRRAVGLSVRPQHRTHRLADDADQPRLSTRGPDRCRTPRHRAAGKGEERRWCRERPPGTAHGDPVSTNHHQTGSPSRMTQIRTLPIRVDPLAGEALDSWLAAIAHRTQTAWADMLTALQPTPSDFTKHVAPQNNWTMHLYPNEAASIAAATGVDATVLAAMTLARYDGTALAINTTTRRVTRTFPWGRARHFRFCPFCLADTGGRWQLQWRLGWAFACTVHQCLLVDACPGCGPTQRLTPYIREAIPHPAPRAPRAPPGDGGAP